MGFEKLYRNRENRYTVAVVAAVLHRFYGLIPSASRELGGSRGALYRFIDRYPEAETIVEEGRAGRRNSGAARPNRTGTGVLRAAGRRIREKRFPAGAAGGGKRTGKTETGRIMDAIT